MEETLKIDEFKNYIDNGDFETIYKIIIDRSVDLAKKIATKKKINLSNLNKDKNIKGTPCGNRGTSCPDQLSKALEQLKEKEEALV